nr:PIN domain-containing protein [Geodermatophilus sp. DF01_2]
MARRQLSADAVIPAIVLAESFSQLRRTFGQPARVAASLLLPWTEHAERILPTTRTATATVFARSVELDLRGNVHDALIAAVCAEHDVPLVTLDSRQHRLALALGATSRYLLV